MCGFEVNSTGTQQKVKFVKCIEDLTTIMDENIVPGSLGGKRPESDKCLTNKDGAPSLTFAVPILLLPVLRGT